MPHAVSRCCIELNVVRNRQVPQNAHESEILLKVSFSVSLSPDLTAGFGAEVLFNKEFDICRAELLHLDVQSLLLLLLLLAQGATKGISVT